MHEKIKILRKQFEIKKMLLYYFFLRLQVLDLENNDTFSFKRETIIFNYMIIKRDVYDYKKRCGEV